MKQYLSLVEDVLDSGAPHKNRTGVTTYRKLGTMVKYDLAEGFPIVTTKKLAWRTAISEMLGFLRGYDSAEDFRSLNCNVWNANANENRKWLHNKFRKGSDDLGRIYGVQARNWKIPSFPDDHQEDGYVDQLIHVYNKLTLGIDDRRLIVSHWNPGELNRMALPPCHVMYQFGIEADGRLSMCLYQR